MIFCLQGKYYKNVSVHKEIAFTYSYPRLDVAVSKGWCFFCILPPSLLLPPFLMFFVWFVSKDDYINSFCLGLNHLLKSPFCAHPKTGLFSHPFCTPFLFSSSLPFLFIFSFRKNLCPHRPPQFREIFTE